MKIVDCFWEIANLGKKTVELTIERADDCHLDTINDCCETYDYVVVKVPMMMMDYNVLLSQLGFVMSEVQLHMTIRPSGFDVDGIRPWCDGVAFKPVSPDHVEDVCARITPDMFSTDRISLDHHFGPKVGMRRYQNWIRTAVQDKHTDLVTVIYQGTEVGFMLFRIDDGVFYLLLNGLYKEWQGKRLGIITPASPLLYLHARKINVETVDTHISSNNVPVVKLYDRLGYSFSSMTYVYVKHKKS